MGNEAHLGGVGLALDQFFQESEGLLALFGLGKMDFAVVFFGELDDLGGCGDLDGGLEFDPATLGEETLRFIEAGGGVGKDEQRVGESLNWQISAQREAQTGFLSRSGALQAKASIVGLLLLELLLFVVEHAQQASEKAHGDGAGTIH